MRRRQRIARAPAQRSVAAARRNFPHVEDDTGHTRDAYPARVRRHRAEARAEAVGPCDRARCAALRGPAAARRTRDARRAGTRSSRTFCTVQSYAEEAGSQPIAGRLLRSWQAGAAGAGTVCATPTPCGNVRDAAGGLAVWQRAIDFHAFAVVALDHGLLLRSADGRSRDLAAAAMRQADMALREPLSTGCRLAANQCVQRPRWCNCTRLVCPRARISCASCRPRSPARYPWANSSARRSA